MFRKGQPAWNKGLTAGTHPGIAQTASDRRGVKRGKYQRRNAIKTGEQCWITNGVQTTRVNIQNVASYLLNGWRKGRLSSVGSRKAVAAMIQARARSGRTNIYTAAVLDGKELPDEFKNSVRSQLKDALKQKGPISAETRQKISDGAKRSSHRRLRRNRILYRGVWMDSSWEVLMAKRLDDLNIAWIRPEPVKWTDDSGSLRNYFPDFYLPGYDLYLDPKNPHAYRSQGEKVRCVLRQFSNVIFLTSKLDIKSFAPLAQRN